MGGLITLGLTGILITLGLGFERTAIVVPPVQDKVPHGGGFYYKRRVRGVQVNQEKQVIILRSVIEKSEIPLTLIEQIKMDKITRIKLLKLIEIALKSTTHITAFFIKTVGSKSTILEKRILLKSVKVPLVDKFFKVIDKALTIYEKKIIRKDKDTQLLNTTDLIEEVEKANILDILKHIEDDEDE